MCMDLAHVSEQLFPGLLSQAQLLFLGLLMLFLGLVMLLAQVLLELVLKGQVWPTGGAGGARLYHCDDECLAV